MIKANLVESPIDSINNKEVTGNALSYITNSTEPKLQVISSSRMNQLKTEKQPKGMLKPFIQSIKSSQSNYAALREQRLLNEKLRAFDSDNLAVSAQSFRHADAESILEMVEQAQSQQRCPKHNGRRSCGICPPTAGTVRKGKTESSLLPEVDVPSKTESVDKAKRELIVQLPNITYSRANTPAAHSVLGDRSALASAVKEHGVKLPLYT